MLSLHLTGSPWFFLLLLPGAFLLWRQYGLRGAAPRELSLLALQGLALILLVVSLAAPELRRHSVSFHDPSVLLLRDRSGSFEGGAYLGLGGAYARFQEALEKEYGARKFHVFVADFHERAWPIAGFGKSPPPPAAEGGPLTDLSAAADFADSAPAPNLQAVFLFSDGRGNLDSGKTERRWKAPVYPVVFSPDSAAEMQPDHVNLSVTPAGGDAEVAWRPVGRPPKEAFFRLLRGSKVLASARVTVAGASGDPRVFHAPWVPDKEALEAREGLRAVLQPAGAGENFDPYNDTLPAAWREGGSGRRVYVLKPVRSLDEKGMLDILYGWEAVKTKTVTPEELAAEALSAKDEVWTEAGAFFSNARITQALQNLPAKIVLYARAEGAQLPGQGRQMEFTSAADIAVARDAEESFPDGVLKLQGLSGSPITAPAASAPWRDLAALSEGTKKGVLMGRYPLEKGKTAFFFSLPSIWKELFDPQSDFARRENVAAYVRAAATLAEREEGAVRVSRPSKPCHLVPFDMDFTLPASDSTASPRKDPTLLVTGEGKSEERRLKRTGPDEYRLEGLALPAGFYRLELRGGGTKLWNDSLEVVAKAALELARIGFDREYLGALAAQSGGAVIDLSPDGGSLSGVTGKLPNLPAAQARVESTKAIRLYNTPALFIAILALLTLSWVLRKRWDID